MANPANATDLTSQEAMIIDLTDPTDIAVPSTPPSGPQAIVPVRGMPHNIPPWPMPMAIEGQPSNLAEGRPSPYPTNEGQPSRLAIEGQPLDCLLYTSPSPRDLSTSRMPSSA